VVAAVCTLGAGRGSNEQGRRWQHAGVAVCVLGAGHGSGGVLGWRRARLGWSTAVAARRGGSSGA
jgi:hypothetical protein